MILINKDMITNSAKGRTEPPPEILKKHEDSVRKKFTETFGWEMTELADRVMPSIARRCIDIYDTGEWSDARKGVALLGNIGTGKTILMKYMAYLFDVAVFSIPNLATIYSTDGPEDFWARVTDKTYVGKDMILDDVGAEQDTKRYGVAFPIVDLIYRRYDIWKASGHRLWLSSNLTGAEISQRYGPRIADRLKEMCHVIPAIGPSMRK